MHTSLALGVFTPSVLLRLARRNGWLDRYDLEVDEIPVRSSPEQFRSLVRGELDAVLTNPDNVVAYRLCPDNPLGVTADVKIVSAVDRGLGLGLYARRHMSPSELGAATWAVDVPTSGFAFVMFAIAESLGLPHGGYRVVSLGSTPQRLDALLAGRCDVTMLNAGNELRAEAAGCQLLGGADLVCSPYLGSVLAVVGDDRLDPARRLARALVATTEQIQSGAADHDAAQEAAAALGLDSALADRYVARLKDERTGLIRDGVVERSALTSVINLRRRYRPSIVDGIDILAAATDAGGLLVD